MITRRLSVGLVLALTIVPTSIVRAEDAPTEAEVKEAIRKGCRVSQERSVAGRRVDLRVQPRSFTWDDRARRSGVDGKRRGADDPAIVKASEIVHQMSIKSNQTYDVTLAILFLARESSGSPGPTTT